MVHHIYTIYIISWCIWHFKIRYNSYSLLIIGMPISIYSTQLGSKETFSPLKSRTGKDGRKRKNIKFLRMYEKKIFRKRRRSKLHQNVVGEWLEDRRSWWDILDRDAYCIPQRYCNSPCHLCLNKGSPLEERDRHYGSKEHFAPSIPAFQRRVGASAKQLLAFKGSRISWHTKRPYRNVQTSNY